MAAHVDSKVVLYGDNGHCSPVKKSKKVYYGCLEAEEEMTSVTLAGDVSRARALQGVPCGGVLS